MKGIAADIPQLNKFMRDLRKIDKSVAKHTRKRFMNAAGKVAADASARAPRKSGRLARHIKPSMKFKTGVGVRNPVPYSAIQEYGGRHKVYGKNWVTQSARPHMRPAALAGRNEFIREANAAVKDAAREVGFK